MKYQYGLTEEQLESLDYIKDQLEHCSLSLQDMCKSEKSDITYGFIAGELSAHLSNKHVDMVMLIEDFKRQKIK